MGYNADQERDERGRFAPGGSHDVVGRVSRDPKYLGPKVLSGRLGTPVVAKAMREHAASIRHDAKNAAVGRETGGRHFSKERFVRSVSARNAMLDGALKVDKTSLYGRGR